LLQFQYKSKIFEQVNGKRIVNLELTILRGEIQIREN